MLSKRINELYVLIVGYLVLHFYSRIGVRYIFLPMRVHTPILEMAAGSSYYLDRRNGYSSCPC